MKQWSRFKMLTLAGLSMLVLLSAGLQASELIDISDNGVVKYTQAHQLPDLDVNHNKLEVAKVGEDYGSRSSSYLNLLANSESLRDARAASLYASYEVGWTSEQSYNKVA
jgi:hypothetical protein